MKARIPSDIILVGEYAALTGGRSLIYSNGRASYFQPGEATSHMPFNPADLPGGYRLFLLTGEGSIDKENQGNYIRERMEESAFAGSIRDEYLPVEEKLLESLLGIREADPALLFRIISDFQFRHLLEIIPESVLDIWIEGQVSNEYYLKLTGPGGDFLLGIAHENLQETLQERWKQKIIWIE